MYTYDSILKDESEIRSYPNGFHKRR